MTLDAVWVFGGIQVVVKYADITGSKYESARDYIFFKGSVLTLPGVESESENHIDNMT